MLARRVGEVIRREIVDELDVGAQAGPRVEPLEEIVAEERLFRHAIRERVVKRVDVVDALADVAAFVEQVLIHVGDRRGVRIDADVAGEHLRERRSARALDADLHARLQHAVALRDAPEPRVEPGAVERVGQGSHQPPTRFHRQLRVGVERDHISDRSQDRHIAVGDNEARVRCAAQQPVEFFELAALALPPHPALLARIPPPFPVKEEKPIGAVPLVELVDAAPRELQKLLVTGDRLLRGIVEVAQQREMQVGIAIGQEPDL